MTDLKPNGRATKFRWIITTLLFFATTINYLDRQVLSLTWKDFIAPEFHWTDSDYGTVTGLFSIFYAIAMLFAGKFVDWMDTKKGFLWAIGICCSSVSQMVRTPDVHPVMSATASPLSMLISFSPKLLW